MRILIVDDEEVLLEMYRDAFQKSGFEVFTAKDGKEVIIEAAKHQPDFILLDIMMTELDGVNTFKHLKELDQTSHIPVGFLTVVPEGVPESLSHNPELFKGAAGFWRKDQYSPDEIVKEVEKILKI